MLTVNTRSITERNWKSVKSTKNKLNLKLTNFNVSFGILLVIEVSYFIRLVSMSIPISVLLSMKLDQKSWHYSVVHVQYRAKICWYYTLVPPSPSRNRPTTLWTSSVYVKAGPTAFMGLGADLLWVTCHLTLLSAAVHLVGVLQAQ